MRLFVGIDIDDAIRQRITAFADSLKAVTQKARWVKPETFHVTLKFIGETKKEQEIRQILAQVRASRPQIRFCGLGFFPNPRSARVFWVGIEADERLGALATAVDEAVLRTGIACETKPYKPHLTLARAGSHASGSPHQQSRGGSAFGALHARLSQLGEQEQDFGTMQAREFILYESKLSAAGARYEKLARFPLE